MMYTLFCYWLRFHALLLFTQPASVCREEEKVTLHIEHEPMWPYGREFIVDESALG